MDEAGLQAFIEAGYNKQNVSEVNLIISLKTISNYTNHLAKNLFDESFEPRSWSFKRFNI